MKNILKTTALGITTALIFLIFVAMFLHSNYDPVMAQHEKCAKQRAEIRLKGLKAVQKNGFIDECR